MPKKWQSSWSALPRNKLMELKPTLEPWQASSRKSRREEVILCRLRVGHTYGTHGYLLRGEERSMCSTMDFKPFVSVLFGHYSLPW